MSAFTDLSDLVNVMTGGGAAQPQHPFFWMDNRVGAAAAAATIAGRMHSLWTYNKSNGATGAVPTTVAAPTNATAGALPFTSPGGGRELHIMGIEGALSQQEVVIAYDRLLHIGGLSGTSTSAQTVGGTLTRNTGGKGNQIWVEIYTQIGSTATTITASYTNQAGTSGRTTQAVAIGGTNNREVTRIIPLPLQSGDTGVQAVASVTLAATTGTAGDFGVTVARPLVFGNNENAGSMFLRDFIAGMPSAQKLVDDECVAFAIVSGSSSAPQGFLGLHLLER